MIHPPENLDWLAWVARWDQMQERYLFRRNDRFDMIAHLIAATQGTSPRILDLGCGTGSLMTVILAAIPCATAIGVDLDPTLLWLAEKRLADYGTRVQVMRIDLRDAAWTEKFQSPFSAVVSATALHWLSPAQLSALYPQIATLLPPGGIFLNADHAASESPIVQSAWQQNRDLMRTDQSREAADDWDGFWKAYLSVLGPQAQTERDQALGDRQGVENGLPLAWHFDHLRQAGFVAVDCFWRADCDAIYGGMR